jgi:hypothetical protein
MKTIDFTSGRQELPVQITLDALDLRTKDREDLRLNSRLGGCDPKWASASSWHSMPISGRLQLLLQKND